MPAAKRERPTITPPVYDLVKLHKGPMHGRKLRVLRGTLQFAGTVGEKSTDGSN